MYGREVFLCNERSSSTPWYPSVTPAIGAGEVGKESRVQVPLVLDVRIPTSTESPRLRRSGRRLDSWWVGSPSERDGEGGDRTRVHPNLGGTPGDPWTWFGRSLYPPSAPHLVPVHPLQLDVNSRETSKEVDGVWV